MVFFRSWGDKAPRARHVGMGVVALATLAAAGCAQPGSQGPPSPQSLTSSAGKVKNLAEAAPADTPETLPTCAAENLTGSIDSTQSGAGSTVHTVRLTNTGGPCRMYGYPGVSLVDARGKQLGPPATREGADSGETVRLNPHDVAHFRVKLTNARAIDPTVCNPTEDTTDMKIYPPDDTGFILIKTSATACRNEEATILTVGAAHAG